MKPYPQRWPEAEGRLEWVAQKLKFFDGFPELVKLKGAIRAHL
ncbi:MAG: hypothetical protein ABUL62_20340 [Myxococcales bacterium]